MSDQQPSSTPAGWYPDGRGGQRWWDGTAWTEQTQQAPGAAPTGPVGGGGRGVSGKTLAIIGGAVGGVLLLIVLPLVLVLALSGGSPEDVAVEYVEAAADRDWAKVCELSTEEDREDSFDSYDVDDCGEFAEEMEKEQEEYDWSDEEFGVPWEELREDLELEIEVADVDEKSDRKVVVEVRGTTTYTGDDDDIAEYFEDYSDGDNTQEITVVKEDGDWKIDA
ncbi:MAG: DUF2510 domain-containing protein [Aeromicrobium sp.]|uniref:DUF2510 domain-containing protein n=1 Tax=Aeromicrobium sp. TaxID=1871063 RepID=UPI0039E27580